MMLVLGIEMDLRNELLDKNARQFFRDFQRQVMVDSGEHFHDQMLDRRLSPGAEHKYRHEPRNVVYKQEIKPEKGVGQGKTVDLQLKGKSRRWLLAFRTITGTHKRVIVRLKAPAYFTRPYVGPFTDHWGRRKRITRQPDKVAELLRNNEQDNEELAQFAGKRFKFYLAQPAVRKFIRLL